MNIFIPVVLLLTLSLNSFGVDRQGSRRIEIEVAPETGATPASFSALAHRQQIMDEAYVLDTQVYRIENRVTRLERNEGRSDVLKASLCCCCVIATVCYSKILWGINNRLDEIEQGLRKSK